MTFAEMRTAVTDYCHLTSADAILRVGKSLNRHYRRITSLVGLDTTRFVTRTTSIPAGVRTATFAEIEKIDRVIDNTTPAATRTLTQVSLNTQRTTQPTEGPPSTWAFQNAGADSVTVLLDTVQPSFAYSLQADGWSTLVTLVADSDEPIFAESFHDVLVSFVTSEELLKKEKDTLADRYLARAEKLLSELRFHYADTHSQDTVQASADQSMRAGFSGGGGVVPGGGGGFVTTEGTPTAQAVAVFTDADTITGSDTVQIDRADGGVYLNGIYPYVHFKNTQYPANEQDIRLVGNGNSFNIQFLNVVAGSQAEFYFTRAGTLVIPGQIQFPVVPNPSLNLNTLDEYREGSWTPAFVGSGGQSGITYGLQEGTYIKIGRLVQCWGRVQVTAMGTITGNVGIGGLPFPSTNFFCAGGFTMYICAMGPPAFSSLGGVVVLGNSTVDLAYIPAGGAPNLFTPLPPSAIAYGTDLYFGVNYIAAT